MKKLVQFFYELGTLRKIARSHRQTLLTNDLSDNIASHSYRVTMIGLLLAKLEKVDANKVVLMCLLHDIGETRSGDQNWVHKKYVSVDDHEIFRDQFSGIVGEPEFINIHAEYEERKTEEAKIAKDADLLDQILLLREYEWQGNNEAGKWLINKKDGHSLWSKSAKKLCKQIIASRPSEWWDNLWTDKRRK